MKQNGTIKLQIKKQKAADMSLEQFWEALQFFIEEKETVSRSQIFSEFGRRKTWTYVANLAEDGYLYVNVVSGNVKIIEVRRGTKYVSKDETRSV